MAAAFDVYLYIFRLSVCGGRVGVGVVEGSEPAHIRIRYAQLLHIFRFMGFFVRIGVLERGTPDIGPHVCKYIYCIHVYIYISLQ